MGTVSEQAPCPKCKDGNAWLELNYRTYCETLFCEQCGFWYESNFDFATKTHQVERTGGFGAYAATFEHCGKVGSLHRRKPLHVRMAHFRRQAARPHVLSLSFTHKVRGKWLTVQVKQEPKRLKLRDFRTYLHADIASTSPPTASYAADDTFDDSIPF